MSGNPARKTRAELRALWRFIDSRGLREDAERHLGKKTEGS